MANDLYRSEFGNWLELVTLTNVLLLTNAIVGLVCLEWAWKKTRRFRNPI